MALGFRVRDLIRPRARILAEVGVKPGQTVLDFGCGPGSYVPAAARLVGPTGQVYALDANPLAIRMVDSLVARRHLTNVKIILSDANTGLPDGSVDIALLYEVLHHLTDIEGTLLDLRRVLKPGGSLSVIDHHLKGGRFAELITGTGLFKLGRHGRYTTTFTRL